MKVMVRLPEKNKQLGICYAATRDGVELPVVDVTHPAFSLNIDEAEQRQLVDKFLHDGIPFSRLPSPIRRPLLRFLLRGSILAGGIRKAQGGFMTGMHTYLLKLGPTMLGSAYASPIDRKIAASLPSLGVRLRLQDMALLMAETLLPHVESNPRRPIVFLNIAGGPAVDSLNALIVLNMGHVGILMDRQVSIVDLDGDDEGPAFGEAALAALSEEAGPLHGVRVDFQHRPYDWAKAEELEIPLQEAQERDAVVICSSEGGLFEYGSDEEIVANLQMLRRYSSVVAVVGSVTRADELTRKLRQTGGAATRPRGLAAFRELVAKANWRISRAVERPFSDQVVLV
jgi:hypothetical protein